LRRDWGDACTVRRHERIRYHPNPAASKERQYKHDTEVETPVIIALCVTAVALIGWLVVPRITHALAIQRDQQNREITASSAKDGRKRDFCAAIIAVRDSFNTTPNEKLVEMHQASTTRVRDECAAILNDIADTNRDGFHRSRDVYLSLTRDQIECRDWSKKVPLATPPARYELGRARLRQLLDELITYAK